MRIGISAVIPHKSKEKSLNPASFLVSQPGLTHLYGRMLAGMETFLLCAVTLTQPSRYGIISLYICQQYSLKRIKDSYAMRVFSGLNTSISLSSALVSWGLAIFLVMQLLAGPFNDERACQTTCVNMLFWISFGIALLGLVFGVINTVFGKRDWIGILSLLAMLGLCGIYVTTMLIGTFGI